ncbi:MAG TPA: DUF6542 domain-containing protein [Pseudonocardia sp.]|nr:DUF6542 domain-containing protein [Pseudonocardia sp.]
MTGGTPTARPAGRPATSRTAGRWPVPERATLGTVLGLPPAAAVGVAFALTALGVFVDVLRIGTIGAVFQVLFFTGCILAVAWVRRRDLFPPMVQPPLLLAVVVPSVVQLSSTPRPGSGITEQLLVVGAPMVNAFPTLAWTTAAVLAVGFARMLLQRTGGAAEDAPPVSARRGWAAARGAARRRGSPPRS